MKKAPCEPFSFSARKKPQFKPSYPDQLIYYIPLNF